MRVDRRTLVGGGVLGVLVAAVVWSTTGSAPQGTAGAPSPRASARAAREAPLGAAVDVRLDRLAAGRGAPGDARRNPFQFQARAVERAPMEAPPAERPMMPVATAPAPRPATPITLKFIGVVQSEKGLRLAVLTDGRIVSHGQEGDIIEGRYRILRIGVESIELSHVDGRGSQTIRLTGQ